MRRTNDTKFSQVARATILSMGEDASLLDTRRLVLESGGYRVFSLSNAVSFDRKVLAESDAILVCHSASARLLEFVELIAVAHPRVKVLRVAELGNHDLARMMGLVPAEPQEMLRCLAEYLADRGLSS